MRRLVLFTVALATIASTGCGRRVTPMPPVVRPAPVRQPIVVYERFRLGTFDFGSSESEVGRGVTDGLPAALLTELRGTERFSLFEGGNIRNGDEPLDEESAIGRVDGYLSGTITKWSLAPGGGGEVCAEIRLSNAWTHEVLYGVNACVRAQVSNDRTDLDRAAIQAIAQEVARSLPRIENANIMSAEGELVLIDRGTSSNVARGMVAYLRGTGDLQSDEALHARISAYTGVSPVAATADQPAVANQLPAIVAEAVIVSVDEGTSIGQLVRGSYALPGDTVYFK